MAEARGKRGWLGAAIVGAVCSVALLIPATAPGAVTCSLVSETMTVSATADEDVFVNRLVGVGAAIHFNGNDCTPAANVLNTEEIVVNDGAGGSAIDITLELANGGFAPGADPEIGSTSEIEIRIDLDTAGSGFDSLTVMNGEAGVADTWRAGEGGINLNAPEPTGPDPDLTALAPGIFPAVEGIVTLNSFSGADTISAQGNAGVGASTPLTSKGLRIDGGAGADVLTGSETGDGISGGAGDDSIDGATGGDAVRYDDASGPVTVNLGLTGPQNTGSDGTDTIASVAGLRGSAFGDDLTGDAQANGMAGAAGADVMRGGLGNDILAGQDSGLDPAEGDTLAYDVAGAPSGVSVDLNGNGTVSGGQGTDTIESGIFGVKFTNVIGSPLPDTIVGDLKAQTLAGGAGGDSITGGLGADTLLGDAGFDALFAQDGVADSITCGADLATVAADTGIDAVAADCTAPPVTPTPDSPASKKCKKPKKGKKRSADATAAAKKKKKGCKRKKRKK